jgi:hypothetical protein
MQRPNGQTMISVCIIALLTFKLDVFYLSVCITHNKHVEILKIIFFTYSPVNTKVTSD